MSISIVLTKPKSKTATKKNHIIECARNEDCKKMKCPGGAKICTGVPLCNGGFCDLYQRSKLKCKIKCPKNKTSPKTHHTCTFKWIDKLDTCHAERIHAAQSPLNVNVVFVLCMF